MRPYLEDPDFTLWNGDALEVLRELPNESVDCAATSPPFYGLRDYGVDGQIGLEASLDEWCARLVDVFREVRRVLRPTGTLWVECGTSYVSSPAKGGSGPGSRNSPTYARGALPNQSHPQPSAPAYGSDGTKPLDSPGPGSACLCLCDGCLDEILSRRDRNADTGPLPSRSEPRDEPTGPSSETPPELAPAKPQPDAQESTMPGVGFAPPLEWTCDVCGGLTARPPIPLAPSARDARASAHTEPCNPGTAPPSSAPRTQGTDASGTAWIEYTRSLKPKDLLLQPFILAMALVADGWYLRQVVVWGKPNAMPESATDRCTTSHSYVLLLSKKSRYHFDAEAISEPAEWARWGDQTVPKYEGTETASGWMQPKTKEELQALSTNRNGFRGEGDGPTAYANQRGPQPNSLTNPGNRKTNGQKERTDERRGFDNRLERVDGRKNARSVWSIPTEGYPEAHFATWPQALVERILKAGCPEGGTVLDPFSGSGTTALVARKLGRRSIGIELNADYCELAAKRLAQQSLLAQDPA